MICGVRIATGAVKNDGTKCAAVALRIGDRSSLIGQYNTLRNDVAAFDAEGKNLGVVFETATPFDTPRLMADLVSFKKKRRREDEWLIQGLRQHGDPVLLTFAVANHQLKPIEVDVLNAQGADTPAVATHRRG